jgi:uncharacterized membrane protein (UPF0127 family)
MPGQAVVTINGKQWSVSVANTYAELTSGLSGVESIQPQTGILFDLGYDQSQIDIDMSEMLFPLDIIFINSTQGVRGVMSDVQPGEIDVRFEATTTPGARFFLEINAGEAEGIEVGDNVNIQGYTQPTQLDFSSLMNFMLIMVVVVMMFKMVGKALEPPKERPKLPPGYKPVYLTEIVKEPPPGYAEWKAKLEAGYGQYRPGISEAQVKQEVRSIPKDVLHYYFREKIGSQLGYLPAIRRTGVAVMPKLPEQARGDFLFFEYIRDLVRLGETITDEEARRMWEAWEKRYSPEPRSLLQTTGKMPYDKELEQLQRDLREGAISEEAYKRVVKEILTKAEKERKTIACFYEIAEWFAEHRREMTTATLRQIASKYFGMGDEFTEFYEFFITPQGVKEFRKILREVGRRHGIEFPPEREYLPMASISEELKHPAVFPQDLAEKVREFWRKACEWEDIPLESKFVVFSDDNPYVKDYNEAVGQLLRWRQFRTGEWAPATTFKKGEGTKLDSLEIVKAYKQISRHGEDKISVSLQAWALFPRGRRPHFISMYRSGDDYVITPLYAHISEWVHVPVVKVKAWIKSLPVKHFEPMAVAPEYQEEAERLAREVDEPMAIIPLPSMARQAAVIPTQPSPPSPKQELEFVSDSPEYLAYTIEDIGYREKLDTAFQTAIARAKGAR